MLHREFLKTIAGLDSSPFGAEAKAAAAAVIDDPDTIESLTKATSSPLDAFLLLWRCVAAAQTAGAEDSLGEFVVTLPTGVPRGARPTNLVVSEMLDAAKNRIVVLGYAFTQQGGIIQRLVAARARGVDILAVCDRGTGGQKAIETAWPTFVAPPRVYVNADTGDEMHKMHCKLIVVDDCDLLVTSANFTYHGMLGNIEFGVRLRDVPSSRAANGFVEHLITTRSILHVAPA